MGKEVHESQINFEKFIPLGQEMTPQEAIEKLAEFHHASPESVAAAFMNLDGFTEGKVEFRESVNSGRPCIIMEGKNTEGRHVWDHLINYVTGQPQTRTS